MGSADAVRSISKLSIPGRFVLFTCTALSPDLHLGNDSHLGLEVRGGLVSWLIGYHFNSIAKLATSLEL